VLIKTYVLFQGGFRLKQWELEIKFNIDPLSVKRRETSFVNMENGIIDHKEAFISAEEAFSKAKDGVSPKIKEMPFLNPNAFVAGQIHTRLDQWEKILPSSPASEEILA